MRTRQLVDFKFVWSTKGLTGNLGQALLDPQMQSAKSVKLR